MELTIAVEGAIPAQQAAGLEAWLRQARLRGIERLEQARRPPAEGEQGPELLALLTVVLSSPAVVEAVVELVRSIHRWIDATRPAVNITIKEGERTVTIDAKNPPSVAELVAKAEGLARA